MRRWSGAQEQRRKSFVNEVEWSVVLVKLENQPELRPIRDRVAQQLLFLLADSLAVVVVEVESRQRGVGAERLGERRRPFVADAAVDEPELLQRRVHLERLRQRLGALVADRLVAVQVDRRHARVGLEDLGHNRRVVRR